MQVVLGPHRYEKEAGGAAKFYAAINDAFKNNGFSDVNFTSWEEFFRWSRANPYKTPYNPPGKKGIGDMLYQIEGLKKLAKKEKMTDPVKQLANSVLQRVTGDNKKLAEGPPDLRCEKCGREFKNEQGMGKHKRSCKGRRS